MLDQFFLFLTWLGEQTLVIAVICLLYWCINKRLAYKICFSFFTSGLLVQTLKIICRVPRPWVRDSSFTPVKKALKTATGYSFPSGHTQSATSLYSTLALNTRKYWIKILCFLSIFSLMLSRMYLGVHTPTDVIISFLITLVLSIFVDYMINKYHLLDEHYNITVCILISISVIVAVFSLVMLKFGLTELYYTEDCCKAAGAGIGFSIGWYIESTYIKFSEKTSNKFSQLLKYVLGITVTVFLLNGLKLVIGTSIAADMIRYIITILWITLGFPFIISKLKDTVFK